MFSFFTKPVTKYLILVVCGLLIFLLFYIGNIKYSIAQEGSPDAIAIRVISNPEHFSALRWYREQGFSGSPQSLLVDGYEAVRDGRTVYVDAGNVVGNELHTNIYIISYNQEAESATVDIFGKILSGWKFNTNFVEGETIAGAPSECSQDATIQCISDVDCLGKGFCNSAKSQITRDTIRLARMTDIDSLLLEYSQERGYYPILSAGTYLPHITISVWPSWQKLLAQELRSVLPIDPINKLDDCGGSNFHPITCWDESSKSFAWPNEIKNATLPANNYVFLYQSDSQGASYTLCAFDETGMINPAKSCRSSCIPYCFNKECGDDGCEGTCPPGCGPQETCENNICYSSCNTGPGCLNSLANAHTVAGYCASGSCWECNAGYSWNGSSCVYNCIPTCTTGPGCRNSLANGRVVPGECCGSGNCYACEAGYVWNDPNCEPAVCNVTCNIPNQPNCQAAVITNAHKTSGECCGNGSCWECDEGFVWDGNSCQCPSVQLNPVSNSIIHNCPVGICPPVGNVYFPITLFLPTGVATKETVIYSLAGNPSWLVINPINGYIQGTPMNDLGTYNITVTATNYCGNSDSITFTLQVLPNEWCGDNLVQVNFGEACDGTNLLGQDCLSLGFEGGDLSCSNCVLNTNNCCSSDCVGKECGPDPANCIAGCGSCNYPNTVCSAGSCVCDANFIACDGDDHDVNGCECNVGGGEQVCVGTVCMDYCKFGQSAYDECVFQ
jgi:hypothetical protein